MTPTGGRCGFAAPLALCMLAAVAGLAASSFHAVAHGRRAATRSWREEQAAAAADRALRAALELWDVRRLESLAVGGVDSIVPVAGDADRVHGRAIVMRVTDRLYWIAATGRVGVGSAVEARRVQQVLVEALRPTPPLAALTSRGAVQLGPDGGISGVDTPPPGWVDCPTPDSSSQPAVLVPEGVPVLGGGGAALPTSRTDPAAADSATYEALGRVSKAQLAARADIVVPAGEMLSPAPDPLGGCRAGQNAVESWGEPSRRGESESCEHFYPVIRAAGDLVVTNGRGQGVLLVEGRLRIRGPFLFAGLIVATHGVEVTGPEVSIYGAVLSAATAGVDWLAGQLRRSTCALDRVGDAAAKPYVPPLRGWAEVY